MSSTQHAHIVRKAFGKPALPRDYHLRCCSERGQRAGRPLRARPQQRRGAPAAGSGLIAQLRPRGSASSERRDKLKRKTQLPGHTHTQTHRYRHTQTQTQRSAQPARRAAAAPDHSRRPGTGHSDPVAGGAALPGTAPGEARGSTRPRAPPHAQRRPLRFPSRRRVAVRGSAVAPAPPPPA